MSESNLGAMTRFILSALPLGRQTACLIVVGLGFPAQSAPPRYAPEMLRCAGFREAVRSDIRNESGRILREERAGRDGLLLVQAVRNDSGIALTAWYDSLQVWREGPEGRDSPDTEGLLGGRWRGRLTSLGRFTAEQIPFIPDEVAEIADLRGVLGDFFPLLAGGGLRVGGSEALPDGRTIRRIGDLAGGEGPVERYTWSLAARSDTIGSMNDTLAVPMQREVRESGMLAWDRRRGPLRWERTVTVGGRIKPKGAIKRGIRSTLIQRIRVTRMPDPDCG